MSRWVDAFEGHPFQAVWKKILKLSEQLTIDDDTVVTNVEEVARFKKAVTFIKELIDSCDPELVPESTWKNFHSQASTCLQQIEYYQNNRNIAHMTSANSNLDNLLTYIRPYQVIASKAAKSANTAFNSYSKTIEASLSSFHNQAMKCLSEIQSLKDQVVANADDSGEAHAKIKELEASCFDDSDTESLNARIKKFENQIEKIFEKINNFRSELFDGDTTNEPISAEIRSALESATSETELIKTLLEEVAEKVKEFKLYHADVFGEKNEKGDLEGGLKNEINTRKKQLDDFRENQEIKYKALNDEIESLLPGATSAGLATAYLELKKSFDSPIRNYSALFYSSIGCLVLISLIAVTQEVDWLKIKFVDVSDFSKLASNILYKLPMVLPILWLAVFASKRRSEALRLQQEYSHKEALAKSYQNFKTQIEALNENSEDLMKKLLEAAIDAVSMNASETLDRKHGDKTPVHIGLDEVIDHMEKLKKVVSN